MTDWDPFSDDEQESVANHPPTEPLGERLIRAGDRMEQFGRATKDVGCALTTLVWGGMTLFILGCCIWSLLFGGK